VSLVSSSGGRVWSNIDVDGCEGWFVGGEGVKWKDDTTVIEVGG
jgi:hypothetical protein